MQFAPAVKSKAKARIALIGPSGSGKTYSALAIGSRLAELAGGKMALIDTERASASLYADKFAFDTLELETGDPEKYVTAIRAAEQAGYAVLIIDSLSHAWMGVDGALEQVDKASAKGGNSYTAWRSVTPKHNRLVDAILQSKCHVIATMRSKAEYVLEKNERTGKMEPRKIGTAPIMRDGIEYEFTVTADMNLDHQLIVGKTRCDIVDGAVITKPGAEFADTLWGWLNAGADEKPKPSTANHDYFAQFVAKVADKYAGNDVEKRKAVEAKVWGMTTPFLEPNGVTLEDLTAEQTADMIHAINKHIEEKANAGK